MKAKLDDQLFEALSGEETPKFLATKDENDIPNVVPIISIQPYDRETLIFGNFLMWKTEKNLKTCPRVSVTCFTDKLFGATIRGAFLGFQKVGEYADIISSSSHMRYNAYGTIRNAGAIGVEEISEPFQLSRMDVLKGLLDSKVQRVRAKRYSQGRKVMHPIIQEMFGRVVGVKVLAFLDGQGDPCAVPLMSLQPAAADVLVFNRKKMSPYLSDLRENAEVAVGMITGDPVAWQVKGIYREMDETRGVVVLKEAFHASPPHMGKKIAQDAG
jgi:predicted pyridoxine 5'-phosphate oxidase superfamily flavin-nucleotide-binding protein